MVYLYFARLYKLNNRLYMIAQDTLKELEKYLSSYVCVCIGGNWEGCQRNSWPNDRKGREFILAKKLEKRILSFHCLFLHQEFHLYQGFGA